jgi:hypothetical protein
MRKQFIPMVLFLVLYLSRSSFSQSITTVTGTNDDGQTVTDTEVSEDGSTEYEEWIQVDATGEWGTPTFDEDTQTYSFPFTASVSGLDGSYSVAATGGAGLAGDTSGDLEESGDWDAGAGFSGNATLTSPPTNMNLTVLVDTGEATDINAGAWDVTKTVVGIALAPWPGTVSPAIPAAGWPLTITDSTTNSPWDKTNVTSNITTTIGGHWWSSLDGLAGAYWTVAPSAVIAVAAPSILTVTNTSTQETCQILTITTLGPGSAAAGHPACNVDMRASPPNVLSAQTNGASTTSDTGPNSYSGAVTCPGTAFMQGPAAAGLTKVKTNPWTKSTDGFASITFNWG